ncbi:MAG TPA: hypothetical protein VMU22_12810 [Rhizomicrobium sp.]|nr:hypothetical protein [Rhizomicrobium sp.]
MQTSVLMDYAADIVRALPRLETRKIEAATVMAYAASYGDRTVRLTWADKVGIYMAAASFGIVAYIWVLAVIAIGPIGADHLLAHGIGPAFVCCLLLSAAVWGFCRTAVLISDLRRRQE